MSRSRLGLLLVIAMLSTLIPIGVAPAAATTGDLVITGVIQGPRNGANPKAVELLVVNDIPNLGIYGLGSADNGGGTDGQQFTFPNVPATAGDFIYVSLEGNQFVNFFGFSPDYLTTTVNVNGDDAIELFRSGVVVDVFGEISVDGTGQPWEYVNGWASRNLGTGADGPTFILSNWTFSGINALVGSTATNATVLAPFPIGSYVATTPTTTTTTTSTTSTTTTSTTSTSTTTTSTTSTTSTTMPEPPPVPPGDDLNPPRVKAEFDRYWTDHHRGWFRVDFSCRDRVDRHPSCVGDINGIPVRDGQKVYLVETEEATQAFRAHGVLYIEAPLFLLTVTGADDAGNAATATAEPVFMRRHWHRWWR
ncbi:MAG TPA: hypothetical protein VJA46_07695 [Acidimicrobiia bacterium]|nr:hypothetical protein [Acidimicrobiia bacterium]